MKKRAPNNSIKRKEFHLIDLTLNHPENEDESDIYFTTTESSLPPLDRASNVDSDEDDCRKQHERNSRSHERVRGPGKLHQSKNHVVRQRHTQHDKKPSQENIVISEHLITLASTNNVRAGQTKLQKDYSFDKQRKST